MESASFLLHAPSTRYFANVRRPAERCVYYSSVGEGGGARTRPLPAPRFEIRKTAARPAAMLIDGCKGGNINNDQVRLRTYKCCFAPGFISINRG